jgi:hypothetical protein
MDGVMRARASSRSGIRPGLRGTMRGFTFLIEWGQNMALTDPGMIDIVVKNPVTCGYDLIVFDDGSVEDEIKRYNLVLEKLTTYLDFYASGQFLDKYPAAKGLPVRCCVVCTNPPNDAMAKVEGINDRKDPSVRLPVIVLTQAEYLQQKS